MKKRLRKNTVLPCSKKYHNLGEVDDWHSEKVCYNGKASAHIPFLVVNLSLTQNYWEYEPQEWFNRSDCRLPRLQN